MKIRDLGIKFKNKYGEDWLDTEVDLNPNKNWHGFKIGDLVHGYEKGIHEIVAWTPDGCVLLKRVYTDKYKKATASYSECNVAYLSSPKEKAQKELDSLDTIKANLQDIIAKSKEEQ